MAAEKKNDAWSKCLVAAISLSLHSWCNVHTDGLTRLCVAFLVVVVDWRNDILALSCLLGRCLQLCSENSRTLVSCGNFFVTFRVLSVLQSS